MASRRTTFQKKSSKESMEVIETKSSSSSSSSTSSSSVMINAAASMEKTKNSTSSINNSSSTAVTNTNSGTPTANSISSFGKSHFTFGNKGKTEALTSTNVKSPTTPATPNEQQALAVQAVQQNDIKSKTATAIGANQQQQQKQQASSVMVNQSSQKIKSYASSSVTNASGTNKSSLSTTNTNATVENITNSGNNSTSEVISENSSTEVEKGKYGTKIRKQRSVNAAITNNEKGETTPTTPQPQGQPEPKCKICDKLVYKMEQIKAERQIYHKNCFKCCTCSRNLSLETYQSHNGQLYCKPHFKEIFQPKINYIEPDKDKPNEESNMPENKKPRRKMHEMIIRENQPAELPSDVVRSTSEKSTGLENLTLDLKTKFQMFENYEKNEKDSKDAPAEPIKKSSSVLSRYKLPSQDSFDGINNDELSGGGIINGLNEKSSSSENEDEEVAERDERTTKERILNSKKNELNKFRTRLCLGKSSQLKQVFENLKDENENRVRDVEQIEKSFSSNVLRDMFEKGQSYEQEKRDLQIEKSQDSGLIRQKFEKGEFDMNQMDERTDVIDKEMFEQGLGKKSRDLFKKLDEDFTTQASNPGQGIYKRENSNQSSNRIREEIANIRSASGSNADVKATDRINEPEIKTADIANKFRFFEKYKEENENKEKPAFRMSPPREIRDEENEGNEEIYHDPSVVRAHDKKKPQSDFSNIKSTSKMRQIFQTMEMKELNGDDEDRRLKPLKEFTPPREPTKPEFEDYEDDEEDYYGNENIPYQRSNKEPEKFDKAFLEEVGSLAKARCLREKFERWESITGEKEDDDEEKMNDNEDFVSIERAKELRAKFENNQFEQAKKNQHYQKVNRFV